MEKEDKTKSYLLRLDENLLKKIKFYCFAKNITINNFILNSINYYLDNVKIDVKNDTNFNDFKSLINDYAKSSKKGGN